MKEKNTVGSHFSRYKFHVGDKGHCECQIGDGRREAVAVTVIDIVDDDGKMFMVRTDGGLEGEAARDDVMTDDEYEKYKLL